MMGLQGHLTPPGDKSIGHRALILSTLCPGTSQITRLPGNQDVMATLDCLTHIGVTHETLADNTLLLHVPKSFKTPSVNLDARNSGTTLRLLSGLLCGLNINATITGDQTLLRRPMGRIIKPLQLMGAHVHGVHNDELAPIHIHPIKTPLNGLHYTIPVASAQVKSALLLAALFAHSPSTINEPMLTRDHTERMLRHLGIPITQKGKTLEVGGGFDRACPPTHWRVPGDSSSAAFFVVAALLIPNSKVTLENVGLNPCRIGFIEALKQVGAHITLNLHSEWCGEPVGDVVVESSQLSGHLVLDGNSSPAIPSLIDEIPILAVAGAYFDGVLEVRGAEELRKKESDRIASIATEFGKLGIAITVFEDGFYIEGEPNRRIQCPVVSLSSHHDHRMAMALSVLNRIDGGNLWPLGGKQWADVSYPGFYDTLSALEV